MRKITTWLLGGLLTIAGCQQPNLRTTEMAGEGQAVYYWRTDLSLDSTERAFVRTHHIEKVYCRYFDVVMRDGEPMPNATLTFSDTLPAGVELVPTISPPNPYSNSFAAI